MPFGSTSYRRVLLVAPVDCSALLYRNPALAREANSQSAAYLAPVDGLIDWIPADCGIQMTRRFRGLPLWFELATHGRVRDGDQCLHRPCQGNGRVYPVFPSLSLARELELSVVLFRRNSCCRADSEAWSAWLLGAGLGFVVPTTYDGEPALRFCFVNPRTTLADVDAILSTLT